MSSSRVRAVLVTLGLAASALVTVASVAPAQAEEFEVHLCADDPSFKPCLVSATLDGGSLPAGVQVASVGKQKDGFERPYFQFALEGDTDAIDALTTANVISTYWDMGKLSPDYTEGFAYQPDVDRIDDGDGSYHMRYSAAPVKITQGCNQNVGFPYPCKTVGDADFTYFSVDVYDQPTEELEGFDRAQNIESVNGIFLEKAGDGSEFLTSEMVNSAKYHDGTVFKGDVRFRIPYHMLRSDFDVPDPSTMVASSLVGQVNAKAANFDIMQDPDGGGVIVDISNIDFRDSATTGRATTDRPVSERAKRIKRVIKVKRGSIKPTKPTITVAKRATGAKAKITFTRAKPRGAKVRGYTATCTATGSVRTVSGKFPTIVVKGLKPGKKYSCKVRAKSKAGPGKYSAAAKV